MNNGCLSCKYNKKINAGEYGFYYECRHASNMIIKHKWDKDYIKYKKPQCKLNKKRDCENYISDKNENKVP